MNLKNKKKEKVLKREREKSVKEKKKHVYNIIYGEHEREKKGRKYRML